MSKKLTSYVHADGKVYKPGDDVPKSVTNPKAWGSDAPADGGGADEETPELSGDYDSAKVVDLKAEIERRNEGRSEENLLSAEGNKADLVAVLEADDDA